MPSEKSVRKIKTVLDTNNLISAQINRKGASREIYRRFLRGEIALFTSPFQLNEFKKVLSYHRIKQKFSFSDTDIQNIIHRFQKYAVSVYPAEVKQVILEDPDDDQILAIAVDAKVNYIISGDPHLLNLGKYNDIPVLSARKFLIKTQTNTKSDRIKHDEH